MKSYDELKAEMEQIEAQMAEAINRERFDAESIDQNLTIKLDQNDDSLQLYLNDDSFKLPNHWFWKQFTEDWELQTIKFFQNNLIKGKDYLDIGAWIGPTALIATALGARKLKLVEPNPVNFLHLLLTQINNDLFQKWCLINACVSNTRSTAIIGPIEGINSGSSATNIRDQNQSGAEIISLTLSDVLKDFEDVSLIKIDIEGAETLIVQDLSIIADLDAAIWLSLHPPFMSDKDLFVERLLQLKNQFYFVDENNSEIDLEYLTHQILTDEKKPTWGTEWGNYFEVGLLPTNYFDKNGKRKNAT